MTMMVEEWFLAIFLGAALGLAAANILNALGINTVWLYGACMIVVITLMLTHGHP